MMCMCMCALVCVCVCVCELVKNSVESVFYFQLYMCYRTFPSFHDVSLSADHLTGPKGHVLSCIPEGNSSPLRPRFIEFWCEEWLNFPMTKCGIILITINSGLIPWSFYRQFHCCHIASSAYEYIVTGSSVFKKDIKANVPFTNG